MVLRYGAPYLVTAEFCAIARNNKRGPIIGEKTGGGHEGSTSAIQIDPTLPATQMTVSFGAIQYNLAVRPVPPASRRTIPVYTILPTIHDIGSKRDTQLERTLEFVRGGK